MDPLSVRYAGLGRRLFASLLDFILIGGYILFLLGLGIGLNALTGGIAWLASPSAMKGLAFIVLVLPVILYFALQESSPRQAAWGKQRVQIVDAHGERPSLWRVMIRRWSSSFPSSWLTPA